LQFAWRLLCFASPNEVFLQQVTLMRTHDTMLVKMRSFVFLVTHNFSRLPVLFPDCLL
jgi:hypothetical protein